MKTAEADLRKKPRGGKRKRGEKPRGLVVSLFLCGFVFGSHKKRQTREQLGDKKGSGDWGNGCAVRNTGAALLSFARQF